MSETTYVGCSGCGQLLTISVDGIPFFVRREEPVEHGLLLRHRVISCDECNLVWTLECDLPETVTLRLEPVGGEPR